MDLRQLTPDIAVSAQITAEDVEALAKAGFKVLINNRPDAEVEPGLDSRSIGMLAQDAGLEYRYIPLPPAKSPRR
ncbi:sulfur transferase domain-containing protein [Paracoccus sp. DMF-8]|uniref:beta-lactamase hydrolase domain-containing protein n=1 Tax=Paracoccus sp. DMF-8 TaxID=3019445 RepID=UPI0023E760C9|nr:sulfur transferase domain-containing protein [Paracoccus sp. DMF-8]MDF3606602.1 sulfur transferase domain-containing protein [Paracoccus sp. DMF-8]